MKKLYLKLTELLATVPGLRWVDLDMGQMQDENPMVAFPCALLAIDALQTENISRSIQHVRGAFSVKIYVLTAGNTNVQTPEIHREKALAYLDLTEQIHKVLQGYADANFYPFERVSARQEAGRQGVTAMVLRFETSWRDDSSN
ncbi:MAG: hypothetical protein Q4G08_04135 [Capnocytophaga sp.]|nr:hypothetical protein [Capnocytophaga sp.]